MINVFAKCIRNFGYPGNNRANAVTGIREEIPGISGLYQPKKSKNQIIFLPPNKLIGCRSDDMKLEIITVRIIDEKCVENLAAMLY